MHLSQLLVTRRRLKLSKPPVHGIDDVLTLKELSTREAGDRRPDNGSGQEAAQT